MSKDDEKLKKRIAQVMRDCIGLANGELSAARVSLKSAYLGEAYTNDGIRAAQGWSTYVDRTVLETVEWAKGPLLKVFASSNDLVRFDPDKAENEAAARDATDYINKSVFGATAFDLVYGPITEALYQRVGWAKVFFEEEKRTEVVLDLDDLTEAEAIAAIEQALTQGIEANVTDNKDGTYRVKVEQELVYNQGVKVLPIPSERVIFSKDAINIESADFVAHWEEKSLAELKTEGYDPKLLESLEDEDEYPETLLQREINSENADSSTNDNATGKNRKVRVYEGYLCTYEKGQKKRLKVTFAGSTDKIVILDSEPWDMFRPPLFCASSLPMPYSPVGLSIADLVIDIQALRTELFRNLLDNIYSSNHGELVLTLPTNQAEADYDQIYNRRAGGLYELKGGATLTSLETPRSSPDTLAALEMSEKAREQRSGVGMQQQGLSADVLQNTATGAAIMEDAQNQRLELIARCIAETFFKPMAEYCLALASKYIRGPIRIQQRGKFAEVYPESWSRQFGVTVTVGLGTGNRQKQVSAFQLVRAEQDKLISTLGKNSPVRLKHVISADYKLLEALDIRDPESYFGTLQDAELAEKQILEAPPALSPEMMKLEIQKAESEQRMQLERQKAEAEIANDAAKIQAAMLIKTEELELKKQMAIAELAQKQEIDITAMNLEAELDAIKLTTSLPKGGATEINTSDILYR